MASSTDSSNRWLMWGFLGCGALSVVCCGMCGGMTFFGMQLKEEQVCAQLAVHPGVQTRVGTQVSCAIAWDALTRSSSDSDTLPYNVVGTNGSVLLDVASVAEGGDSERIIRVTVIQDDGTYVPLEDGSGAPAVPPAGATVRIVEIAEDDAYYNDRGTLVNRRCTVGDDVQPSSAGGGWLAGTFQCGGTDNPYFYKVKVE
jgi:hypothetical protein